MSKNTWVQRFGTLKDVVTRKTAKGAPYATFTLQGAGFDAMGTTFQAGVVEHLLNSQGEFIRLSGVLEDRTLNDGRTVKSFKAIKVLPNKSAQAA
jgi:hypothetical protein